MGESKDRRTRGRRSGVGRVKNRGAREDALIGAASKLFAMRGYEATTTREIAAEAGCAEGLIHRYFHGKAGLLLAIIQSRVSKEVVDMGAKLPRARTLDEEILQITDFELDHMWAEREFFKVLIPRAMLDPALGPVVRKMSSTRRTAAIAERLRKFERTKGMSEHDVMAIADFAGVIGFMFGFMRPVVLGDDRARAKDMAIRIARLFARAL
jgi:AcrR family transcriptional regulator